MKQTLEPSIHDLRSEFVLVQAWKKTVADIRARSWYSDTLEIDYQSLRLPKFIAEIQDRLKNPSDWAPCKLELVPAPKNQQWTYDAKKETWKAPDDISSRIRPLAHVELQDQVVATALMLCLADRVESKLGDPRIPITKKQNRNRVLSYGHRLFCDPKGNSLQHRWGSSKLYRQYFQDYRTFLDRPNLVAQKNRLVSSIQQNEVAIVHADFSKFYDTITPELLSEKASKFCDTDEPDGQSFNELLNRVFDWRWSTPSRAKAYASDNELDRFERVALPQGLTASGFFANVILSDFDDGLRGFLDKTIDHTSGNTVTLLDACYYVDDFRIVLSVPKGMTEKKVGEITTEWLRSLIGEHAPGLRIQEKKTLVTVLGRDKRFLVPQSTSAKRIQSEVSNTFDMLHGSELIATIEGFFHTQKRYPESDTPSSTGRSGLLVGMSDMRDDTAARFAAGKYLRTYRLLRPLLEESSSLPTQSEDDTTEEDGEIPTEVTLTKEQLDEKAKVFAALLIEEWMTNPANVRLLRVALNLYPDVKYLNHVLTLLGPSIASEGGKRGPRREVQVYCLTEIFRAGATETGLVRDGECLPEKVKIEDYHSRLTECAVDIFESFIAHKGSKVRFPWYLMQQVFLYLSARDAFPEAALYQLKSKGGPLLDRYRQFALFLDSHIPHTLESRAIFLGVAATGFGNQARITEFAKSGISSELLAEISQMSPTVGNQLWEQIAENANPELLSVANSLGLNLTRSDADTLAAVAREKKNPFWEEENVLELAIWLLSLPDDRFTAEPLTPWNIELDLVLEKGF